MRLFKSVTRTRDYFVEVIANGSEGYCTAVSEADHCVDNKKTSAWEVSCFELSYD